MIEVIISSHPANILDIWVNRACLGIHRTPKVFFRNDSLGFSLRVGFISLYYFKKQKVEKV